MSANLLARPLNPAIDNSSADFSIDSEMSLPVFAGWAARREKLGADAAETSSAESPSSLSRASSNISSSFTVSCKCVVCRCTNQRATRSAKSSSRLPLKLAISDPSEADSTWGNLPNKLSVPIPQYVAPAVKFLRISRRKVTQIPQLVAQAVGCIPWASCKGVWAMPPS